MSRIRLPAKITARLSEDKRGLLAGELANGVLSEVLTQYLEERYNQILREEEEGGVLDRESAGRRSELRKVASILGATLKVRLTNT